MKKLLNNRLSVLTAATLLGLGTAGAMWQGAVLPAHAQEILAVSRSGRVDGKTSGEVVLRKKVALRLLAGSGSMGPVERADLVASRLNRLDAEKSLKASEIRVTTQAGAQTLVARGTNILSVTTEDARIAGRSQQAVADDWMDGILDALGGSADSRNDESLRGRDRDEVKVAANQNDRRGNDRDRDSQDDYYPELKKKLVPIITLGSSLNVGIAQVQGAENDVDRCKAVAQLETDYKDVARIKILVPIQSEGLVKNIDRVPGVSVSALADYAIKR